jgi:quercetin dioxygenase-like cupin family protein
MKTQAFVIDPQTYPTAIDVLGVRITVLADRARTGGYEITLQEGAEGAGPPPHRHDWDEAFFVLDGEVEITSGERTVFGRPGTLVYVPAGTAHGYRFGKGGGRMFELSQGAAGTVGATRMFRNVARDMSKGPPELPKLVRVLEDNGVTLAAA